MRHRNKNIIWLVVLGSLLSFSVASAKNFTIYNALNINQPYFSVNGTTGNVGIATTTPAAKLEVAALSGYSILGGNQKIGNVANPTASSDVATLGWVNSAISSATGSITLWGGTTGGNIWSLNSGNVGIGTSNPANKLHIYTNTARTDQLVLQNPSGSATTRTHFGSWYDATVLAQNAYFNNGWTADDVTKGSTQISMGVSDIVFQTAPAAATPSFATRMTITNNGSVGIGTTNPGVNKVSISGAFTSAASNSSLFVSQTGGTAINDATGIYPAIYGYSNLPGWYANNLAIGVKGEARNESRIGSTHRIGVWGHAEYNENSAYTTYAYEGGSLRAGYFDNIVTWTSGQKPLTTAYGLYVKAVNLGTGSRVNNVYGLYLDNNTINGTVEGGQYGVYQLGSGVNNYFAGNVGIATTTPAAKLEVAALSGYSILAGSQKIGNVANPTANSDVVTLGWLNSAIAPLNPGGSNSLWNGTSTGNIWSVNSGNVGIGTTNPAAKADINVGGWGTGAHVAFDDIVDSYPAIKLYAHTGDGTTFKSYQQAVNSAGTLKFYSGSSAVLGAETLTERMAITTGGYVGIGTTTPRALLDVYGNATIGGSLIVNDNATGYGTAASLKLQYDQDNNFYELGTRFPDFFIKQNTTEFLTIKSGTGNVGIGTTNPGQKLDVYPSSGDSAIRIRSADGNAQLYIDAGGTNKNSGVSYNLSGAQKWFAGLKYGSTNNFAIYEADGSDTSRLTIIPGGNTYLAQNGGNVGIATTTPAAKLEVAALSGYSILAGNQKIGNVAAPLITGDVVTLGYLQSYVNASSSDLWSGTKDGTIWNGAAGSGKVGIGTVNPTAKLSINATGTPSTVQALSVVGNGAWGSGYLASLGNYTSISQTSSGQGFMSWGAYNNGSSWVRTYDGGMGLANLVFGTGPYFSIQTDTATSGVPNFVDRLTVGTSGNVGIGINPSHKLDVNGTINIARGSNLFFGSGDAGLSSNFGTTGYLAFNTWGPASYTEKMRIDGAGNVGIGTTTPSKKLTIITPDSDIGLRFVGPGGETYDIGEETGNEMKISSQTYLNLHAYHRATSDIQIRNADILMRQPTFFTVGNVGIATTTPAAKLEVAAASGYSILAGSQKIGNVALPTANSDAATKGYVDSAFAPGGSNSLWNGTSTGNIWNMNSGNVGIGTTAPGATIVPDLATPGNVLEIKSPNNVNALYMRRSDGLAGLNITNEGQNTGIVYLDSIYNNTGASYSGFQFRVRTSGTPVNAMRIDGNGNVGIGIMNPTSKLDVAGSFEADNGYKIVRLPRGDGATNSVRWYLLAALPTNSYRTLSFNVLSSNYFDSSTGQDDVHFQITNWLTSTPVISYWVNKGSLSTNIPGRIIVTNEGDGYLRVYCTVARYGDATLITQEYTGINGDSYSLNPAEFAQGSAIPSGISASVIYDTSTAAPNHYFALGNTGIGYSSPGTAALAVNGNVGIGTTNPTENLQVGNGAGYAHLMLQSNGGGGYIKFNDAVNATTQYIGHLNTTGAIQFAAGTTTPQMTFNTAGNLGIGTTVPAAKLEVAALSGYSILAGSQKIGNVALPTAVSDAATKGYVDSAFAPGGSNSLWNGTSTGNIWNMNSGNVGVGTSSPALRLHVVGYTDGGSAWTPQAVFQNGYSSIGQSGVRFRSNNQNINYDLFGYDHATAGDEYLGLDVWSGGATNAQFRNTPAFALTVAGNVGIGTTSPLAKLDVQGTDVGATKAIIVRNSAGTDNFSVSNNGQVNIQGSTNIVPMSGGSAYIQIRNNATGYMTVQGDTSYGLLLNPNGGNVGIGTSTPGYKLDVYSGYANATRYYARGVGGAASSAYMYADSGGLAVTGGYIYAAGAGNGFYVANTATFRGNIVNDSGALTLNQAGQSNTNIVLNPTSGNVGIGTTSPVAKLEVAAASGYSILAGSQKIGNVALPTAVSDAATKGYVDSSFAPGGSNSLWNGTSTGNIWNMNSGNVGIGTTNPGSLLELRKDVTGTVGPTLTLSNIYHTAGTINEIQFRNNNSIDSGLVPNAYIRSVHTGAGNQVGLQFGTRGTSDSLTTKMTIDKDGNVGVGITNPNSRLHSYNSTADGTAPGRTSVIDVLTLETANSTIAPYRGFGQGLEFRGRTYSNSTVRTLGRIATVLTDDSGTDTGTSIVFQNVPSSSTAVAPVERMRIDYNGNVGIGTSAPGTKLEVIGSGSTFATTNFRLANSNNTTIFAVQDHSVGRFTGQFQIIGAGASRLYVEDTASILGNVGIGTTTLANARLTILPSGQNYAIDAGSYRIGNVALPTAVSDAATKGYVDSSFAPGGSNSLWNGTSTGNIWNMNSGNVGIGTTNPAGKLTIQEGELLINNNAYSGSSNGLSLKMDSGDNNIYIVSKNGNNLNLGTDNSVDLTIKQGGYVGIGTTAPLKLLSMSKLAGDAVLRIENTGNGNSSGIDFIRERQTGTGQDGGSIFMDSDTATNNALLYIQAQSASVSSGVTGALSASNGVRLLLRGGTGIFSIENGATESMRIVANGNVGIGTSAPGQKLSVVGTGSFHSNATSTNYQSQIRVGWSDSWYGGNIFAKSNINLNLATGFYQYYSSSAGGDRYRSVNNDGTDRSGASIQLSGYGEVPTSNRIIFYKSAPIANNTDFTSLIEMGAWQENGLYVANNVGIGTTTPTAELEFGSGSGYSILAGSQKIGNVALPTIASDAATKGYVDGASTAFWNLNGSNLFASSTTWNVGIGTTNPGYKLELSGGDLQINNNQILATQNSVAGGAVYTFNNVAAYYDSSANAQGYLVIDTTIPQDSNVMYDFDLIGHVYISSKILDLHIGAYSTSEGNGGFRAFSVSSMSSNMPNVQIARNTNGKTSFIIGAVGTDWRYTNLSVPRFSVGYSRSFDYANGWDMRFTTDISAYTNIDTIPYSLAGVTGSGTGNYLTKWQSSGTGLTNSTVFDNGTNVGIGTTGPHSSLEVSSATTAELTLNRQGGWATGPAGIKFATDNNVAVNWTFGMLPDSTNNMHLKYSTTEPLTILTGGNVGIGTTSPAARLEVVDNAVVNYSILAGNKRIGNVALPSLASDAATKGYVDGAFAPGGSNSLWNGTSTGNIWNLNSGNVGVGTTSPVAKLEVVGDLKATTFGWFRGNSNGTNAISLKLGRQIDSEASLADIYTDDSTGDILKFKINRYTSKYSFDYAGPTYSKGVEFNSHYTAGTQVSLYNEAEATKVYLNTNGGSYFMGGNVGVGTTNPGVKLGIDAADAGTTLGSSGVTLNVSNSNATANNIAAISFGNAAGGAGWSQIGAIYADHTGNSEDQHIFFRTIEAGAATEKMRITNNGNVGIGTTNPGAQLEITVGSTDKPAAIINVTTAQSSNKNVYIKNSGQAAVGFSSYPGAYTPSLVIQNNNNSRLLWISPLDGSSGANARLRVGATGLDIYTGGTTSDTGNLGFSQNISGLVSIGTTTPANAKLTIVPNGQTYAIDAGNYKIGNVAAPSASADVVTLAYLQSYGNASSSELWSGTKDGAIWNGAAGAGNVGIGTTNPGSKLSIAGIGVANTPLTLTQIFNTIPYVAGNGMGAARIELGHGQMHGYIEAGATSETDSSKGYLAFGNLQPTNVVAEVMRINQSGNVGIGTTNPTYKLYVNGTIAASSTNSIFVPAGAGYRSLFSDNFNYYTPASHSNHSWFRNSSNLWSFQGGVGGEDWTQTAQLYLAPVGTAGADDKLIEIGQRVSNAAAGDYKGLRVVHFTGSAIADGYLQAGNVYFSGNLGIGTTTPAYKLHSYAASANLITSEGNGGSDYYEGSFLAKSNNSGRGAGLFTTSFGNNSWFIGNPYNSNGSFMVGYRSGAFSSATADYTNAKLFINSSGNMGIATTTLANAKLTIVPNGQTYAIDAGNYKIGNVAAPLVDGDVVTRAYLETYVGTSTGYLPLAGGTMNSGAAVNMNNGGISSLSSLSMNATGTATIYKLNVTTIDPLYKIKGINYATYAASISGGVKEEYVGKIKLKAKNNKESEAVVDFAKLPVGDDLWVWRQVVDFNKDNVDIAITPYGHFAQVYYLIEGNKLIFRADKPVEISYRLIGRRFDWRDWPTKPFDQSVNGIEIK
ncbi:MAG: hypothetical protein WC863_01070 [Patescibacteria group bacterium]